MFFSFFLMFVMWWKNTCMPSPMGGVVLTIRRPVHQQNIRIARDVIPLLRYCVAAVLNKFNNFWAFWSLETFFKPRGILAGMPCILVLEKKIKLRGILTRIPRSLVSESGHFSNRVEFWLEFHADWCECGSTFINAQRWKVGLQGVPYILNPWMSTASSSR